MKSNFFTVILLMLFLASTFGASFAQVNWTKDNNNPILSPNPGTWESSAVSFPYVLKDSDTLKMWYNGDDGTYSRAGYATSTDGINWTKATGENPVLDVGTPGSWDDRGVYNPNVLFDGASYKMWYGGWDGTQIANPPYLTNALLGYATSPDGINWTKDNLNNPVMGLGTPGSWDDESMYGISLLYNDSLSHIWFGAHDGNISRIGHATSIDGIHWNRDTLNNPVLDVGAPGEWDALFVFLPHVLFDGSIYHMWYTGGIINNFRSIGYATSDDGINWTKDTENNPVMSRGPDFWDNISVQAPFVLFDDATFEMWYAGWGNYKQIGYATAHIDPPNSINNSGYKNIPKGFVLSQNYPNPFNPSTKIKFALPIPDEVKIELFNTLGQRVETLLNKAMKAGYHKVEFNAQNLSSGIYFYRIEAGEFQDVKKMILIR